MVIKRLHIFPIFILALVPSIVSATSGYICISKAVTGFAPSDNEWAATSFTTKRQYNISRAQPDENNLLQRGKKPVWVVKEVGQKTISFYCMTDLSSAGTMRCEGVGGELWFSNKTLRFQEYYAVGYVDNSTDTPSITIGTCFSY